MPKSDADQLTNFFVLFPFFPDVAQRLANSDDDNQGPLAIGESENFDALFYVMLYDGDFISFRALLLGPVPSRRQKGHAKPFSRPSWC
jgi:hypothetical protein